VTAGLTNRATGATEIIEADHLVAADGFHSPVRQALGIEVDGPGPMFTTMTAIVEADLTAALRGRSVTIAYLQQPRPFTILMAHDDTGRRWVFGTGYDPRQQSLADFSDEGGVLIQHSRPATTPETRHPHRQDGGTACA
jgi:putative polyketide hydroxylase